MRKRKETTLAETKGVNKNSKFAKGNTKPTKSGTTNKPNKGYGAMPKKPAKYVRKGSFKGDNQAANNGESGPAMQSAYRRSN